MNNKKILEAKKAIENLIDNWIKEEEIRYLENLEDILQIDKYKNCKYHMDVYDNKIELENIAVNKLCNGFNYTDLRILEDFFSNKNFYNNIYGIHLCDNNWTV